MSKVRVIPTDVYVKGQLEKIEFHDLEGEFVVETVWDWEHDPEQNPANREEFRKWSYRIVGQLDDGKYEVLK